MIGSPLIKDIVITGGSRGIGKYVADRLGKYGAVLNIIARTESELEKTREEFVKKGYKVKVFRGDVKELSRVKEIISLIGRVDVLVNCAGIQGEIGPFYCLNYKSWREAFDINFFGTVNCISASLPLMIKEKRGKIINFSGGGANYSRPNFTAYGVSKAAIVRLTETLADELRDHNIQVNAVSPGIIKTRMIEEILSAGKKRAGTDYEQVRTKSNEGFDTPDLVAELVCYLASEESNWITGKVISAIWDPWKEWKEKETQKQLDKDIYVLRRIDGRQYVKIDK